MSEIVIPFNKPSNVGFEYKHVTKAIQSENLAGQGFYSRKCQSWFEERLTTKRALLTPSCTSALEIIAILLDVKPGDEIIMPSYTFVSSANSFVLRGAKIVFIDVRPDTLNIDENKIIQAITSKTKAILVVHYAGVACEMDSIMSVANKYGIYVVEDAAQAVLATYKSKALGTIGHFGAYSFHETKNLNSGGEGGLLLINDEKFCERAEIVLNKGTNRSKFLRGQIDKYTWVDIGGSHLLSELQAAYLWAQLVSSDEIHSNRLMVWNKYDYYFNRREHGNFFSTPSIPSHASHNGHIYHLRVKNSSVRDNLIAYLKEHDIQSTFHYVPLHSSEAGKEYGFFCGEDIYTTKESQRLLRMPLFYGLDLDSVKRVVDVVYKFFSIN